MSVKADASRIIEILATYEQFPGDSKRGRYYPDGKSLMQASGFDEDLTFGTTPEELLPQREGSLLPRACGVIAEAVRGFDKGWSVVFCYDPAWRSRNEHPDDRKYSTEDQARVVVMDEFGSDLFVPHTNVALRFRGIQRLPGMDDYERAVKGAVELTP